MPEKPKVKEIFAELAKKSGLPEDQAKAWLATLDNEQLQSALGEIVMTRSDYSRTMNEIQKVKEQAETERKKYEETHDQQVVWYDANKRALDEYPVLKRQLEAYRTLYGELDSSSVPDNKAAQQNSSSDNGKNYVTAEDIAKAKRELWELQEQLDEAKDNYYSVFGKPMPFAKYKELKETALKPENQSRPLREVYNNFIRADVKAEEDKATQKRIDDAVAAARADERAKRHFPDETGQEMGEEISALYRPVPKEPLQFDEIAAQKDFIKGLYEKNPTSP